MVLFVNGMLVDLSVAMKQVTVSVAIMQLEVFGAHMQVTVSAAKMWLTASLVTRVIQYFFFLDKPMKGGDILDF